jgi:peroxiredoxin
MQDLPVTPPPLQVSKWLNTREALSLDDFRGRVVVIEAFQMLCPGCVSHALPQAARIHALFPRDQVAVIGLHTVFEHHAAMNPEALAAFLHEYRIDFPVGVDTPSADDRIPQTMRAWELEGTPSLVLIDRAGRVRLKHFGRLDDMRVGAEVMALVGEPLPSHAKADDRPAKGSCDADGCALP